MHQLLGPKPSNTEEINVSKPDNLAHLTCSLEIEDRT